MQVFYISAFRKGVVYYTFRSYAQQYDMKSIYMQDERGRIEYAYEEGLEKGMKKGMERDRKDYIRWD